MSLQDQEAVLKRGRRLDGGVADLVVESGVCIRLGDGVCISFAILLISSTSPCFSLPAILNVVVVMLDCLRAQIPDLVWCFIILAEPYVALLRLLPLIRQVSA